MRQGLYLDFSGGDRIAYGFDSAKVEKENFN